jgi:hypothetical protein
MLYERHHDNADVFEDTMLAATDDDTTFKTGQIQDSTKEQGYTTSTCYRPWQPFTRQEEAVCEGYDDEKVQNIVDYDRSNSIQQQQQQQQ